MKKIILLSVILLLISAGCKKSSTSNSTTNIQNNLITQMNPLQSQVELVYKNFTKAIQDKNHDAFFKYSDIDNYKKLTQAEWSNVVSKSVFPSLKDLKFISLEQKANNVLYFAQAPFDIAFPDDTDSVTLMVITFVRDGDTYKIKSSRNFVLEKSSSTEETNTKVKTKVEQVKLDLLK